MARSLMEDELQQVTVARRPRVAPRLALTFLGIAVCAAASPQAARAQGAVTLCHATGNPAAPYVQLTVAGPDLEAHVDHTEDLVPAPPLGCPPTAVEDPPVPSDAPDVIPTATAAPPDTSRGGSQRAERRRARARARARRRSSPGSTAAPGAATLAPAAPVPAAPARAQPLTQLALTGRREDLVVLTALGLLMAGLGLRRLV
jgi:hypothetical protein